MEEDLSPRAKNLLDQIIKEDLDPISIDELRERIKTLKEEIDRCEKHIEKAGSQRAAADALFKS